MPSMRTLQRVMRMGAVAVVFLFGSAFGHDVVPDLPFPNNPDPELCGIPQPVGEGVRAVVHGMYDGRLIEPVVHLVDSHLRREVTGHVPADTVVEVVLYQENPELDFYFVRFRAEDRTIEGWVPEPYLTLR